jgi:hypothetical protein
MFTIHLRGYWLLRGPLSAGCRCGVSGKGMQMEAARNMMRVRLINGIMKLYFGVDIDVRGAIW